jgi:hypothetical protein
MREYVSDTEHLTGQPTVNIVSLKIQSSVRL